MGEEGTRPWWRGREGSIDFFALGWEPDDLDRAVEFLEAPYGVVPAEIESWYRGGLGQLCTYLRELKVPQRHEIAARRDAFLERPRPFLPSNDAQLCRPVEVEEVGWVDPRKILLKLPGRQSLVHDNSNSPDGTTPPVEGIVDFAERLAHQRDDSRSLRELFGDPDTETPYIDVEGWALPSGSIFRILFNGNHRVVALASLGVPCVLARIHWCSGPFETPIVRLSDIKGGDRIHNWWRLLHTYGIAAFSEFGMGASVQTEWPILLESPESAVASLAAAESITCRRYTGTLGQLPRDWFENPEHLERVAVRLADRLAGILNGPVEPHF
ncbi:hypothetical protein ABFV47_25090 [Mycolicibacterium fortuitum]|uniref:hypothetical protein n=1 Tax=Mycolicibacterium TaxID=1866885 RepID=UPI0032049053